MTHIQFDYSKALAFFGKHELTTNAKSCKSFTQCFT